jgi:membrane protein implicated in regulation of membrane protease activity
MSIVERIIFELGPWSWWIGGLLLLGLEVVAPGTFFLWFGLSALVVGTLALFFDIAWQAELVLFGVLSLVSLLAGRALMRRSGDAEGDPSLNRRGSRLVGREFVLEQPISQGDGRVRVDDTIWRVTGDDMPSGTRIRVERLDGPVLVVVAVPPKAPA